MKYSSLLGSSFLIVCMSVNSALAANCDYSEIDTVRYEHSYVWSDHISNPSNDTLSIQSLNVAIEGNSSLISGLSGPNVFYWDIGAWASNVYFANTLQASRIINRPAVRSQN